MKPNWQTWIDEEGNKVNCVQDMFSAGAEFTFCGMAFDSNMDECGNELIVFDSKAPKCKSCVKRIKYAKSLRL